MSAQNESLIYRENFTLSTDYYGSGKKRTGAAACLRVIFCGINIIFMVSKGVYVNCFARSDLISLILC